MGKAALENTGLLETVEYRYGCETTRNLSSNVGHGVISGDTTIEQSHNSHCRVEVTATDRPCQERENGKGCTNRPGIAGCDNDAQKDECSEELYKNG